MRIDNQKVRRNKLGLALITGVAVMATLVALDRSGHGSVAATVLLVAVVPCVVGMAFDRWATHRVDTHR